MVRLALDDAIKPLNLGRVASLMTLNILTFGSDVGISRLPRLSARSLTKFDFCSHDVLLFQVPCESMHAFFFQMSLPGAKDVTTCVPAYMWAQEIIICKA